MNSSHNSASTSEKAPQQVLCKTVDKDRARNKAHSALRRGDLKRSPCARCGRTKAEMHHPDYAEPLAVIWLCRGCHRLLHRMGGIYPHLLTKTVSRCLLCGNTNDFSRIAKDTICRKCSSVCHTALIPDNWDYSSRSAEVRDV